MTSLLTNTLLMTALCLAGCLSTSTQLEHVYALPAPVKKRPASAGPTMVIATLRPGPGVDSEAMAYRVGESELRYYVHRKWAAEPARLISDALVRHLRTSGLFSRVRPADEMTAADLTIDGVVEAIEQVDYLDPQRWHARLALSLIVKDNQRGQVLFEHEFDRTHVCVRNDPAEVARVIGRIVADEAQKLIVRIGRSLPPARPAASVRSTSTPSVPQDQ